MGRNKLIEYFSSFTPLSPGDVIVSGTPGGVGWVRKPPLWMKPGDVCRGRDRRRRALAQSDRRGGLGWNRLLVGRVGPQVPSPVQPPSCAARPGHRCRARIPARTRRCRGCDSGPLFTGPQHACSSGHCSSSTDSVLLRMQTGKARQKNGFRYPKPWRGLGLGDVHHALAVLVEEVAAVRLSGRVVAHSPEGKSASGCVSWNQFAGSRSWVSSICGRMRCGVFEDAVPIGEVQVDPVGAAAAPAVGHRAALRVPGGEDVFADLELGKELPRRCLRRMRGLLMVRCALAVRGSLCRILYLRLSSNLRLSGFLAYLRMKPQRSIARSTISQIVPSVVRPLARAARMNAHSSLRSGLGFTSRTNSVRSDSRSRKSTRP